MKTVVLHELQAYRVVPALDLSDASFADELGAALVEGGIPCAEVTLRAPGALEALRTLASNPHLLVGAGTVLTPSQVDVASAAGARFIVSPGFRRDVVERTLELGLLPIPGVSTPSEVQAATALGLTALKLFPAEVLGGTRLLDALAGPFPAITFMPSGGLDIDSITSYLSRPTVFAVSGTWMTPRSALQRRDAAAILQLVRRTAALARPRETADPR